MATNASPFIVNIIDLQNISTDIRGTTTTAALQTQITNLQKMINPNTRSIYTDNLASLTSGSAINILSDLNFSNTSVNSGAAGSGITNSSGVVNIVFTTPFMSAPFVTATITGSTPGFINVTNITVTGFTVLTFNSAINSAPYNFNWNANV